MEENSQLHHRFSSVNRCRLERNVPSLQLSLSKARAHDGATPSFATLYRRRATCAPVLKSLIPADISQGCAAGSSRMVLKSNVPGAVLLTETRNPESSFVPWTAVTSTPWRSAGRVHREYTISATTGPSSIRFTTSAKLPWTRRAICLVIAEAVFEHVLRPDRAAANVYEMLRPGGNLRN